MTLEEKKFELNKFSKEVLIHGMARLYEDDDISFMEFITLLKESARFLKLIKSNSMPLSVVMEKSRKAFENLKEFRKEMELKYGNQFILILWKLNEAEQSKYKYLISKYEQASEKLSKRLESD